MIEMNDELVRSLMDDYTSKGFSYGDAMKLTECTMFLMDIGDLSKSEVFNEITKMICRW